LRWLDHRLFKGSIEEALGAMLISEVLDLVSFSVKPEVLHDAQIDLDCVA